MVFLLSSVFLLAVAYPMIGSGVAIWVLLASQVVLLIGQIKTRQVTGVGGFIFMYVLFFGMRPLYLYLENDIAHFTRFFLIRVSSQVIGSAMWWATLALFCFAIGARIAFTSHRRWLRQRAIIARSASVATGLSLSTCMLLVALQLFTLPVMMYISSLRRSVYASDAGAYLYDLPMPMQAIHIFVAAVIAAYYWKKRSLDAGALLVLSVLCLLAFTWLMREVSNFRGFYLTGIIVAGLAVLHQFKRRVGYAWLLIPILVALPFFAYLGAERNKSNDELAEEGIIEEAVKDKGLLASYWHFYSGAKDMNIFDTFVAAKQSEPRFYPYAWSWAYVALHWVPRAFWAEKPQKGLTQDMRFTRKAPLSPGISGFFLLDGGLLWMLGCMVLLGYLVGLLDANLLTAAPSHLRSCLIGIVVVNGMFLSRVLLWQYFYQMLYMAVVVVVLAWWVGIRPAKLTPLGHRRHRGTGVNAPSREPIAAIGGQPSRWK